MSKRDIQGLISGPYGHSRNQLQAPKPEELTMSRLSVPSFESATGATAEIYGQIKKAIGNVPNTFAAIGAHGPAALKAVLAADAVLATGSLSKRDQETIKLVISGVAGCDYCVAAHSLLGKLAGLKPEELKNVRDGKPTGDAKRDALISFVRKLAATSGTVSEADFAAIREAGYSDAQLVDISLAFATTVFTNVFNRINDTDVDFPAVV
jgi:uncharacterized peroxidase-related enzyme